MKTTLPSLSDFRFDGNSLAQLQDYFKGISSKPSLGISLVASPYANLRVDLAYALLASFTEGGVEGDIDGGGASTLEAKPSYELPEVIRMQQLVYANESEQMAACTRLLRSAPQFLLIDNLSSAEMAGRALQCSLVGIRVIAGVAAPSTEKAHALFSGFPAAVLETGKIDLTVWAASRDSVSVNLGK